MAMLPPQRPRDDGSPDAAGAAVLRGTAPLRAAALTALVASAFLALVAVAGLGGAEGDVPSFLGRALGPEEADAPLARTPAPGVGVRIHADGYTLRHGGSSVSVASEDVGGGDWRRHAHGVTRPTGFGAETIVVDGTSTEEFLTVTTRQGERTWRWRLATRLVPRLGRDGSVAFLDPTRHLVTGLVIDPVRILDERGEDVTPAGLRWSLRTKGSASWLALELDDAGLPLPYVIDPAVSHRAAQTAVQAGGTSLVVAVPAGVQANDLLVAHVARGGNAAFTPPAGWTAAGGGTYGNFLNQATYYRIATGSEPASYTWTWSGSRAAAGGMSAYYGAKASDPVDVVGALTTANGTTVTAASVTTTAPDALVLAFFATNSDAAYSTAAGMTERYEAGTAGAASVAADDLSQPAPGATGAKTSTASASGRNAGHQVAFQVDDVDPVVAQGDPGTPLAGTISLVANASDTDSAVAQVQLQRSPAGAGTWTDVGAPDVASPYTASFDTTTVPDGLYDLRAVATDAAGNVAASAAVGARRVDNTAPSSTTAFPTAAATYGASGWNAGCAPSGLCGTAADGAGSGLQSVEVSVRRGTGDYWDGGAFASAAEAWHAATLAAGDWSYALSAAQLPADGDYTIRVRSTDAAGNVEAPAARTFTFDATPPETTIDSAPASPTDTADATFDVSASEGGSTFECRLDGGAWSGCASPVDYTGLADGSHTFDVRATDSAGNTDSTPASSTWLVDTAAPTSTTAFPAAGGEYGAAGWDAGCPVAGLCGTAADGTGAGVQSVDLSIRQGAGDYWDGSAFASASEVWVTATLAAGDWSYALDASSLAPDGGYTVRVRATDAAGNAESPSSRAFVVDTTAPSALVAFPAGAGEYRTGSWNAGCATVGFCGTASDATSGVAQVEVSVKRGADDLYWDGDSFDAAGETFFPATVAGSDWSYAFPAASFPADGSYTVHARATDEAGNTESGSSRTFSLDDTDPSALFTFPAPGASYGGAGWDAGCTAAGLCGTASDSGSGVAQVEVSLKLVGADLYWDGSSFSAPGETFFPATLAGGDWSYGFPAASFPADGSYTLHARATDDAGNTESGPTRTFTYDTAAPATTIDSSPADPTTATDADFSFSASEGGSTFECRLDGGPWGACSSPESYAGLADGDHTFDVRATDAAGNTEGTPAGFSWTVDTAAPSSTVAFPAAAGEYGASGWNAGCATSGACGTVDDGPAGSGVQAVKVSFRQGSGDYWNGASFSSAGEMLFDATVAGGSWSRPFPASNFPADGDYTVRVYAVDEAGNAESPSSRTFAFDGTPPAGSLTAPADGAAVAGTVTLSADSTDSGAGVASAAFMRRPAGGGAWQPVDTDTTAPYAADWDTTAQTDGDHELRVVTTDEAGNTFTSPTRTVTVDNTAPSSAVLTALPAAIRDGQELTGSGGDAGSGVASIAYLYCEGTACAPSTPIGSSATGPDYAVTWVGQPADGDVRVIARVTDVTGNSLDSAVQTVLVDNTSPAGSLTAPADGAAVAGTVTLSADSTDSGAGVASAAFMRRPAGGGAWQPVDTDTTAPYAADWDTTAQTDGDHELRVVTTDEAGNTFTSPTRTVTVDNTAPTATIVAPSGFVNGGSADPFTVAATSPDGDVVEVEFFRCSDASSDCGGGAWVSLGVDPTAPYAASWPLDADGNRALRAVARDAAGNGGADVVNVTLDRTDPAGALTAPADGAVVTATVPLSSDSSDAGSGVASAAFERRPLGGGAWTPVGSDTSAPYAVDWDTTAAADGDHELRVVTTDEAGNASASATRTVTVDNSAPSAPSVALTESSPYADVAGSEIFVNTAGSGTYDVEATSGDPHSGIDTVRFPGPADDSTSPYAASYDLDELAGPQTVTAFNGAGLSASTPFTVTVDTAPPAGGSVSYADGYDADGDVPVTVDGGTDALAGIAPASAVLERRTAALSDGSCDPFAGAWSAVASPDTVASGLCAQYRYRISDRVGNEAVYTSGDVVAVDLAAPSAPALALSESSSFAHVVGTEVFVNTAESGSYDVEASSGDAASGLEKIVFPGGSEDTTAPYVRPYDLDELSGTQTVTAHDRAGNTASSSFDVTEDVSAPSTTDDTTAVGSGWQDAPVTVTLTPTDARSGVAATYWTTDGSLPTDASDEGTSIDLTADGVYTIRYFSVDNVGNVEPVRTAFFVVRIDRTDPDAPAVALSESSPYAHVSGAEIFVNTAQSGTFGVEATSADAGSGLEQLSFPGGVEDSTSPYSASYALGDLAGAQTVTAHDLAGNSASDTFTVTPDTDAPAGGFVSYPDGADADGVVTVDAGAGADALSGIDGSSGVLERRTAALAGGVCDPFAGPWSAVTSPDTVPADTCAQYRYRVSDRVANEAVYASAAVVTVDGSPPETTIDAAPSDPSADASPTFAFSASEPASTFACSLDGGPWAPCTSPEALAGLADGGHTFQVRATDAAGNADATPAEHAWTVDTAAPDTTLDAAPADPSGNDTPTFAFSASEPGSTFECSLDGGAWAPCTSPEPAGPLADGPHAFAVRAVDAAGTPDATPAAHAWTVDTTPPDTTLDAAPSDPSGDPTPGFAFSATEGGSTFECSLDGGAWSPCSSPVTVGPLGDGPHSFAVRAADALGNADTSPAEHDWNVNAVAPTVALVQPSGFVNAADADPYTVRATSPDGDLTTVELFRCSDDSVDCATGSWVSLGTDATAPYEAAWPVDADGARALRAVATDAGANTGEDVVTVTIDRAVPSTTIDSAPADPSASDAASFSFGSNEPGASFECRLDAGPWAACTSPEALATLADGGHTFSVRASDAAGNVDATPASFAWTVDTVAPQTTIDAAPADPSPSASPTFEFSADEPGSTFACRLDGGPWAPCTSPEALAGVADGGHTFQVRAADAAGNADATPASHGWTVDATAPGGGLADPGQYLRGTVALAASPTDTGVGVQSVDFQVSPADAGAWASIDVDSTDPFGAAWDTSAGADGAYDLRVVVTDNAGNTTSSPVLEDRVVDNTAPAAAMDDPGAYLRATVSLTASASDAGSGVASVAFERSPAGAGSWSPAAASWDTTGVADGLYDLRVTVTDTAGNSSVSATVAGRRVDNTKPSLGSSAPVDGATVASAGSLALVASEDVAGIANAELDGVAAPAPSVSGDTVTLAGPFATGPHTLSGALEDLAGNRQQIRVHFTVWAGPTADYPYVEKNSFPGATTTLRSTSDAATLAVPAGAWAGAPAGDWLVVRLDPQPAGAAADGFEPAGDVYDVTAYWALDGSPVTSFALPLELEVDDALAGAIPATFEDGAWRALPELTDGGGLPASWDDGFERDGTNVRLLTRHLSSFALLRDVQAPGKPGAFKGAVSGKTMRLSWSAAADNSGLVSAYRVYAGANVLKTVSGTARSAPVGRFRPTDARAFRVAAVDQAGNVGPKTYAVKAVPALKKLTLAAARKALAKRGFKQGKLSYKRSASIPKGRVIGPAAGGLRRAGTKVPLVVSKGAASSRRPVASAGPPAPAPTVPPAEPPEAPPPAPASPVTPVAPAAPEAAAESPVAPEPDPAEPDDGPGLPFSATPNVDLSELRQELGFGLLVAAFSVAFAALMRARRPRETAAVHDDELLWDARLLRGVGTALRRLTGRR